MPVDYEGAPDRLREIVESWIDAWTRSRRTPPADRVGDALRVHVGQQERWFEFVVVSPDADAEVIASVARLASDTPGHNWVSVFTRSPDTVTELLRAAGLTVERDVEWVMTVDLADQPQSATPHPYDLAVRREGEVAAVTITAPDGAIAATGQVGFSGAVAVPDRIVTSLDHRRKGLGAAMMSAIVAEGIDRGATRGILTASLEGERLYTRMGWKPVARLVIGRTV